MGKKRDNKAKKLREISSPKSTASCPTSNVDTPTWAALPEVVEHVIGSLDSKMDRKTLLACKLVNTVWNKATNDILGKRCVSGLTVWDPDSLHWRPDDHTFEEKFHPLFIPKIKLPSNRTRAGVNMLENLQHIVGRTAERNFLFQRSIYIYGANQGESGSKLSRERNWAAVLRPSGSVKGKVLGPNLSSLVLYGVTTTPGGLKTLLEKVENLWTLVIMNSNFIMDNSQNLKKAHPLPKFSNLKNLILKSNVGPSGSMATQNCICMWLLDTYGSSMTHFEFDGAPDVQQKNLPQLQQLKVIGLQPNFIRDAVKINLVRLSILKVNNINVQDFETFINHFSETLAHLHLDLDTMSSMDVSSILLSKDGRWKIKRNENQIMLNRVIKFGCPFPTCKNSAALLKYLIAKFPSLKNLHLILMWDSIYSNDEIHFCFELCPELDQIETFEARGDQRELNDILGRNGEFLTGRRDSFLMCPR